MTEDWTERIDSSVLDTEHWAKQALIRAAKTGVSAFIIKYSLDPLEAGTDKGTTQAKTETCHTIVKSKDKKSMSSDMFIKIIKLYAWIWTQL